MNQSPEPLNHSHVAHDKTTKISLFLSLLCTIHCVITPILLIFLGIYPSINATFQLLNNPFIELGIILFSGTLGFYTMWHGFKHHHTIKKPLYLFGIGILFFCIHYIFHGFRINEMVNLFFSLTGSVFILWSQVLNYRLMNKTKCIH